MTDLLPYFRGKYPALFSNDALREIACLAGWLTLLDGLCLELQSYMDARPELPPARVLTIKEKFGGLRFYICGEDQHCRTMIALAQERSLSICEVCGKEGSMVGERWVSIRCPEHAGWSADQLGDESEGGGR